MTQRTSPFKLFALPSLPINRIISFLSVIEIFELSQCSQASWKIVKKSINKKVEWITSCAFFDKSPDRPDMSFSLVTKSRYGEEHIFNVGIRCSDYKKRRFAGHTVYVVNWDEVFIICGANMFQIMRDIVDYILDLFQVDDSRFCSSAYWHDDMCPDKLSTLRTWTRGQCAGRIGGNGDMSSALFQEFVDKFLSTSKERVFLRVTVKDPENLKSIRFRNILSLETNFITPEMLLNLDDVKLIDLKFAPLLSSTHLNLFIKMWMNNLEFQPNFRRLYVMIGSENPLNYAEVIEGLELVDLGEKRREVEEYSKYSFYLPIEKEIIRSDGKVATLTVAGNLLLFVVWDIPFHSN